MSLRNKPIKKDLSDAEVAHMRKLGRGQFEEELNGKPRGTARSEDITFFKKGDGKTMKLISGAASFDKISDMKAEDGTVTSISYKDKAGRPKRTTTVITKDKKLLDSNGKLIRELY